jgi:hypothetical protein
MAGIPHLPPSGARCRPWKGCQKDCQHSVVLCTVSWQLHPASVALFGSRPDVERALSCGESQPCASLACRSSWRGGGGTSTCTTSRAAASREFPTSPASRTAAWRPSQPAPPARLVTKDWVEGLPRHAEGYTTVAATPVNNGMHSQRASDCFTRFRFTMPLPPASPPRISLQPESA